MKTKNKICNTSIVLSIFEYVLMYGWLIIILFPFTWIISLALRNLEEVYTALFFPKHITFENFIYLFKGTFPYRNIEINFLNALKNSFFVTLISVTLILLVSILASYAFSKLKFFGKSPLFYFILAGMMIPVQVIMLPLLRITQVPMLQGSLFRIILPYIALGIPLTTFLLTGFFRNIPAALIEAAKIEGAGDWQILFRIMLPLAKPAIGANIIFQFMYNWNEFPLALTLLQKSKLFTIPVEISKVQGQYMTPWNIVATTIITAIIPVIIVYLIFQKQFVAGLTAGALKE